jgi:hypothetical protein
VRSAGENDSVFGPWSVEIRGWSLTVCVWLETTDGFTYSWLSRPLQVRWNGWPVWSNAEQKIAVTYWHPLRYMYSRCTVIFDESLSKLASVY